MKVKSLLTWFFPACLALNALILPAYAQQDEIGGEDVLVSKSERVSHVTKMGVAGNGKIFVVDYTLLASGHVRSFRRSENNGKTFSFFASTTNMERYPIFGDIVVVGDADKSIQVWIAQIMHDKQKNTSSFTLCRYGYLFALYHPYEFKFNLGANTRLHDVAIASNCSSPSPDLHGGAPYALAIAITGSDLDQNISFLDYIYSLDAGTTWQRERIHTEKGVNRLGKVDISIGSTHTSLGCNTWPIVGIVFEKDRSEDIGGIVQSQIGFLANFIDYDSDFRWTAPIIVSNSLNTHSPKIQMLCNSETANAIDEVSGHNFIIAYSALSQEGDWDIEYAYPKSSFRFNADQTPTKADLGGGTLLATDGDDGSVDLQYDKYHDTYMITCKATTNNGCDLCYMTIPYQKIQPGGFKQHLKVYAHLDAPGSLEFPLVAIHPIEQKACWMWNKVKGDEVSVLFDAEWAQPSAIEEIIPQKGELQLWPNPTRDYVMISLSTPADYRVILFDMEGHQCATASFSGQSYQLDVQQLAAGTYMLHIMSGETRYTKKIVIK